MKKTCLCSLGSTFVFVLTLAHCGAVAQEMSKSNPVDAKFTFEGNKIRITYSMSVPLDRIYEVQITMRSVEDSTYAFVPRSVTGQIGQVKYLGGRLEAWWDFKQDNPAGFSGDFFFEVNVTEVIEEGGWKWWHFALGGAGVAGALLLLLPKEEGSVVETQTAQSLPNPPRIQP